MSEQIELTVEMLEARTLMSAMPVRINAGGKAFTDASGNLWAADQSYTGGAAGNGGNSVAAAVGKKLYNTRRSGDFSYSLTTPDAGTYIVQLLFHDPQFNKGGKREFDVSINGSDVLTDFDIAAAGGGGKNSVIESFTTVASSNTVAIAFTKGAKSKPVLSGIEIDAVPAVVTDPVMPIEPAPPVDPTTPANPTPPTDPTPPADPVTPTPVDFTQITWTTKAAGPITRAEALKAKVGDKLYVFGGFNGSNGPVLRSDVYTPATNTWTQIANLPEKLTHTGVAVYGRNVYFVGGYVGSATRNDFTQTFGTVDVWIYNVDTNTFTAGPALPAAYAGGGAVIVGSTLHFFGGFNLARSDVNIHLTLDLTNPAATWRSAPAMLNTVNHMGYVNYDDKIYAIAGQTGYDAGLVTQSAVQIFDPATNQWTYGANMPGARSHIASATFVMGDRILVMGGESSNGVETSNCYAYTPATNTWTTLTSLPTARFSGVADVFDGNIFFTSGGNSTTTYEGAPVLS